jgi:hypothetical protein
MRKAILAIATVGAVLPFLSAAPAQAQATRTWVSGVGDDANPCSRTAPCKTFAGAISKTAAGGEIDCLDPGGFGAVTITKSLTIDCGGVTGGILASLVNGVVVNNATPSTVVNVTLRNLSINGAGKGTNGIRFLISGSLHVDNVMVQNFTSAPGFGLDFTPNNSSKLVVSNSYFYNNSTAAAGAGIRVRPTAGATAGVISRTVIERGFVGLSVDSAGGGSSNVTLSDSTVMGNASDGVFVNSAGVAVAALVDRATIVNNAIGLHANGNAGAVIRVGGSVITGNGNSASPTAGGQVLSYLNNAINANGTDTFPPTAGGLH